MWINYMGSERQIYSRTSHCTLPVAEDLLCLPCMPEFLGMGLLGEVEIHYWDPHSHHGTLLH